VQPAAGATGATAGASPGPLSSTPGAAASPGPGAQGTPGTAPATGATPRAQAPSDPDTTSGLAPTTELGELPEGRPAELPLPIVGAGLLALGLVASERWRRPRG
jgi:hypothetical protein